MCHRGAYRVVRQREYRDPQDWDDEDWTSSQTERCLVGSMGRRGHRSPGGLGERLADGAGLLGVSLLVGWVYRVATSAYEVPAHRGHAARREPAASHWKWAT